MAATTVQGQDTPHVIHPNYHLDQKHALMAHHVMMQLSIKGGMNRWKERCETEMSKGLSQLHFPDTFQPVDPKYFSKSEYDQVL